MGISGTESLEQTDEAASRLKVAADTIAELVSWISEFADRVGCGEYAAACVDDANEGIDLVRSIEDLVRRKREALFLASIGMESTAAGIEEGVAPLMAEISRSTVNIVKADTEAMNSDELDDLMERVRSTDNLDQDELDELRAELQIQLELKTGDFESASKAADLVAAGAELDDALDFVAAGDDIDAQLKVLRDAGSSDLSLADAIMSTLDLSDKQDLRLATEIVDYYITIGPGDHRPITDLEWGDGADLNPTELANLVKWIADYRQLALDKGLDVDGRAFDFLDTLEAGVAVNSDRLRVELMTAIDDAVAGGDVDAALELLLAFGERDEELGGFNFDEARIDLVGLSEEEAQAEYQRLLALQVAEYELPDRPSLRDLLLEALGDEAEVDAVQLALGELITNYDLLISLQQAYTSGDNDVAPLELKPTDLDELRAIFDYPDWYPEDVALDGMTQEQIDDVLAQRRLREKARIDMADSPDGVDFEVYVERVKGEFAAAAGGSNMSIGELEAMIRRVDSQQPMVWKFFGALESTDVLTAQTGKDFLEWPSDGTVSRETIDLLTLNMIGRSFLSEEDIAEIDGNNDQVLSLQDLQEWLPDSGLPLAVQDVLLATANAGSIDEGLSDKIRAFASGVGTAVTVISAGLLIPGVGSAALATTVGAVGMAANAVSIAVAAYQGDWGAATVDAALMLFDLKGGGKIAGKVFSQSRAAFLRQLKLEFPIVWERIAARFPGGELDDLASGTIERLDIDTLTEAVRNPTAFTLDELEEFRLLCANTTVNGRPIDLSPAGIDVVVNGDGPMFKQMVEHWETLSFEKSWELYGYVSAWPETEEKLTREEFEARYNEGLRFDPYTLDFE